MHTTSTVLKLFRKLISRKLSAVIIRFLLNMYTHHITHVSHRFNVFIHSFIFVYKQLTYATEQMRLKMNKTTVEKNVAKQ